MYKPKLPEPIPKLKQKSNKAVKTRTQKIKAMDKPKKPAKKSMDKRKKKY
tara:strand:+ start:35 stop:184 length:150 start_codon:yes stop_codon:yes gene_type:complete